jgi:hypothetical protein
MTQALVINSTGVISTQILTSVINMVLDSGSSYSYIPTKDYEQLYAAIFTPTGLCAKNTSTSLVYCNCSSSNDSRYQNISLYVGNRYRLYFNRTEYFTYDTIRRQCLLTIIEDKSSSSTFWLMGDSFMRAYYIIHDMEN